MHTLTLALVTLVLAAPREWRDSVRDIYVDGRLDRSAQLLTTTSPRLFAVLCGEKVYLLDPASGTVAAAQRDSFALTPDRTGAISLDAAGTPRAQPMTGRVIQADRSTWLATAGEESILLASHQSPAGPLTIDELWATVPVWRSIAETYIPDEALVARLREISTPAEIEIVLATWCGDSRYHVPRLLKSIESAANPNLSVRLTGIGPEFLTPMDVVAGQNVTNVPTIIVRRGDVELGRMVETPALESVEADVAAIAAGEVLEHRGRIERGRQLAAGTYLLFDRPPVASGTERFEVYERPGGGLIAHSVIARDGGISVETWASIGADGRMKSVEVTDRSGTVTRTRFRENGALWSAHSRGANGGIVDQSVALPAAIVTPATVTWVQARNAVSAYVVPESGIGTVQELGVEIEGDDVPTRIRFSDGSERRLVTASR